VSVIINGGAVTSEGGFSIVIGVSTGDVTVTGGAVTAAGSSIDAINVGNGSVTVTGGTVTVTSEENGRYAIHAGIGDVAVTGGSVTSPGNRGSAIHAGTGDVAVIGGTVTATGSSGVAIGVDNGNVEITGGTVTAEGHAIYANNGGVTVNGDALIYTGAGYPYPDPTKGIVFEGADGMVYGDVTLPRDLTIESGETLTIPAGDSLAVPSGTTLTVDNGGVIENGGAITVNPILYTIDSAEIPGVTVPVTGAAPVTVIESTAQYTGTVEWSPDHAKFAASTVYTATITLTPEAGCTLTGVEANYFTVNGATATNEANAGVVTAVFPATSSPGGGGGGSGSGGGGTSGGTNPPVIPGGDTTDDAGTGGDTTDDAETGGIVVVTPENPPSDQLDGVIVDSSGTPAAPITTLGEDAVFAPVETPWLAITPESGIGGAPEIVGGSVEISIPIGGDRGADGNVFAATFEVSLTGETGFDEWGGLSDDDRIALLESEGFRFAYEYPTRWAALLGLGGEITWRGALESGIIKFNDDGLTLAYIVTDNEGDPYAAGKFIVVPDGAKDDAIIDPVWLLRGTEPTDDKAADADEWNQSGGGCAAGAFGLAGLAGLAMAAISAGAARKKRGQSR
jgi:hypothetical protein